MRMGIFDAIDRERDYQLCKWGPRGNNRYEHSVGEWLLIIESELEEAKEAWVRLGVREALEEVLQVASVAVACMEEHGVVERLS